MERPVKSHRDIAVKYSGSDTPTERAGKVWARQRFGWPVRLVVTEAAPTGCALRIIVATPTHSAEAELTLRNEMSDIQRYGERSESGAAASRRPFDGELGKGFQAIRASMIDYTKKSSDSTAPSSSWWARSDSAAWEIRSQSNHFYVCIYSFSVCWAVEVVILLGNVVAAPLFNQYTAVWLVLFDADPATYTSLPETAIALACALVMPLGVERAVAVAVGLPEVSCHTSATFTTFDAEDAVEIA